MSLVTMIDDLDFDWLDYSPSVDIRKDRLDAVRNFMAGGRFEVEGEEPDADTELEIGSQQDMDTDPPAWLNDPGKN